MTATDVKRLYCECYAVAIMSIRTTGSDKLAEMFSVIPGTLFCASFKYGNGVYTFVLNDVKVTAEIADRFNVTVKIGKSDCMTNDASDLIDLLYDYGTYPISEDMCTVDYIRTWRTLLRAVSYTAAARLVVDRIDAFLKKC